MATVREIAEFAGVSKSTVSLVLNNKPGVSDEMRQFVLKAAQELASIRIENSLSDPLSYSVTEARPLSMMVLHPSILRSSYVFSEVLQGIQSAAEIHNVQLRLVINQPEASDQHVAHLYLSDDSLKPDGVLVFGARREEPLLDKVVARGIPCVVLGREAKKYDVSGIERDEARHATDLARHLIGIGHRQIAFVGGELAYDYTLNRLQGYQHALHDAGIGIDEKLICLGDGAHATAQVLELNPDLTAIIYVNDSYAAEGLMVLHERGLLIPEHISVASFDDTDIAQMHDPPLTSIAYNRIREGQWAVKMLIDQIRNPAIERAHVMFGARLMVRASTAAPQAAWSKS